MQSVFIRPSIFSCEINKIRVISKVTPHTVLWIRQVGIYVRDLLHGIIIFLRRGYSEWWWLCVITLLSGGDSRQWVDFKGGQISKAISIFLIAYFSVSKIIRIFLKKSFIEEYQFRGRFFAFVIFSLRKTRHLRKNFRNS